MKTILINGTSYPLQPPLPNHVQLGDLREMIAEGNHKSASGDRADLLSDKMSKEVERGWNIPLLPTHLLDLIDAGAEIAPMCMATQGTINERGEIVMKDIVIHNQSMKGAISGKSINDQIIEEELAPLHYGHMMSRLIHQIVAMRTLHPNKRILLRKDDFKSAYRRQHLNGWSALKTIVQIVRGGITFFLLSLRLTFGGCANPSEWTSIAEPICDLATNILNCDEWDPNQLHSPLQNCVPEPSFLSCELPFTKAKPLMMGVPVLPHGYCDEYVDDLITAGVDFGKASRDRLQSAAPLAIFVVARDIHPDEPIKRENLMCMHKMEAEGGLEEEKVILGWHFNTRPLLISLPENLKRRRFHFSPLPPQIFSINHESGADAHQYDDSGNRSSKRVKLDKGTIDNVNRRPEWKLKDGENYAKVFGRPDDVCHRPDGVCLRWHIKGYCFGNCKHHHGEPTEAQASQITKFIKKMRARISNMIGESTA